MRPFAKLHHHHLFISASEAHKTTHKDEETAAYKKQQRRKTLRSKLKNSIKPLKPVTGSHFIVKSEDKYQELRHLGTVFPPQINSN